VRLKLAQYVAGAAKTVPSIARKRICPHTFRHSTAVALVAEGVGTSPGCPCPEPPVSLGGSETPVCLLGSIPYKKRGVCANGVRWLLRCANGIESLKKRRLPSSRSPGCCLASGRIGASIPAPRMAVIADSGDRCLQP
jgi:hypothetical protein